MKKGQRRLRARAHKRAGRAESGGRDRKEALSCFGRLTGRQEECMYYIGVDLGTSAVKLLLMEGNGRIANVVSREYPLYFPHPGWSEQKPEDWYAQAMAGIGELLEGFDREIGRAHV